MSVFSRRDAAEKSQWWGRTGDCRRSLADRAIVDSDDEGPMREYNRRVETGKLRDDEHQRGWWLVTRSVGRANEWTDIIQSLQHLHDELRGYKAPAIIHPSLEDLKPMPPKGVLGLLFRGGPPQKKPLKEIPEDLPRGLYLYGDVGSGKTMLMDMFYETLPSAVVSKTRIHFHNFMQDVHRRLHKMKMEHGNDLDAVPFVAADMAEKGNVLCFDEFQCTDVADAMILRRYVSAPSPLYLFIR